MIAFIAVVVGIPRRLSAFESPPRRPLQIAVGPAPSEFFVVVAAVAAASAALRRRWGGPAVLHRWRLHGGYRYGYRFEYKGRTAVVTGDTGYCPSVVKQAAGVDLLVHEACACHLIRRAIAMQEEAGNKRLVRMMTDLSQPNVHTDPAIVMDVAKEAKVKHLAYTHIVPPMRNVVLRRLWASNIDASGFDGSYTIGEDGACVWADAAAHAHTARSARSKRSATLDSEGATPSFGYMSPVVPCNHGCPLRTVPPKQSATPAETTRTPTADCTWNARLFCSVLQGNHFCLPAGADSGMLMIDGDTGKEAGSAVVRGSLGSLALLVIFYFLSPTGTTTQTGRFLLALLVAAYAGRRASL